MLCSSCDQLLAVRLMPDFCSSGMWCLHCGVEISNPKEDIFPISEGLIDLIEGWNTLWDMACSTRELNDEYAEKLIMRMGRELAHELGKYIQCWFDEKNSKIYHIGE